MQLVMYIDLDGDTLDDPDLTIDRNELANDIRRAAHDIEDADLEMIDAHPIYSIDGKIIGSWEIEE